MMSPEKYLQLIEEYGIREFGFDTHAVELGISKDQVKELWNTATNYKFKRVPRTEYTLRAMPRLSTRFKPYWQVILPEGHDYMAFYLTPTTPILIPNGFITDKGSIPWMLRGLVAHDDIKMVMAFLVHDLECETKRMLRFTTDAMLLEVGAEMGAWWGKRNLIYAAVRTAAWRPTPDRIVRGFNVSEYNRNLIAETEQKYLSQKHEKHLDFIEKMHSERAII